MKPTFSAYKKPTNQYYDPEQGIALFEEAIGRKASKKTAAIIHTIAPIVNFAFKDGLQKGKGGIAVGQAD